MDYKPTYKWGAQPCWFCSFLSTCCICSWVSRRLSCWHPTWPQLLSWHSPWLSCAKALRLQKKSFHGFLLRLRLQNVTTNIYERGRNTEPFPLFSTLPPRGRKSYHCHPLSYGPLSRTLLCRCRWDSWRLRSPASGIHPQSTTNRETIEKQ